MAASAYQRGGIMAWRGKPWHQHKHHHQAATTKRARA